MPQPAGTHDRIYKALAYLLETRRAGAAEGNAAQDEHLLDETGMRFNLSPHEAQALARVFHTRITDTCTDICTDARADAQKEEA